MNPDMNPAAMSDALDAIGDEALKLLDFDLPEDVQKKVDLIISIARYKLDVRIEDEKRDKAT